MGVPTAAAVERMGGHGTVCATYIGKPAPLDALRAMNVPAAGQASLKCCSLDHMLRALVSREPCCWGGQGWDELTLHSARCCWPLMCGSQEPRSKH